MTGPHWPWALAGLIAAGYFVAVPVLAVLLGRFCGLAERSRAGDQPVPGADQAIANVIEPPAPGKAAGIPRTQQATPAPGHHRGSHMVIDTWQCGCIYTWTKAAGWVHDYDCAEPDPGQDPDEWLKGLTS